MRKALLALAVLVTVLLTRLDSDTTSFAVIAGLQ